MIYLNSPFAEAWKDKDPFEEIKKLQGKICRSIETRQTLNFQFKGESFYIKIHKGTSIKEVMKNLVCLRLPVLGARNEFKAINRLHLLGVNTMEVVAFGERGVNPLQRESFIITKDLNPAISLEDFCRDWKRRPPSFLLKKRLIEKVARMVKLMHDGGVNHRDCYICHFLLKIPYMDLNKDPEIAVIDLHRAQIRNSVPRRWRDKDIIGLYYSCLDIGLTKADLFRFLKLYFAEASLREIFEREADFIRSVEIKSNKILKRTFRKNIG